MTIISVKCYLQLMWGIDLPVSENHIENMHKLAHRVLELFAATYPHG